MTGNHSRSESLFYYFRLEDQVPEKSSATPVDHHINFDFVRATAVSNSSGGRIAETSETNKSDFRNGFPIRDRRDGSMISGQTDGEELVPGRRGNEFFAISAHCTHYGDRLTLEGRPVSVRA